MEIRPANNNWLEIDMGDIIIFFDGYSTLQSDVVSLHSNYDVVAILKGANALTFLKLVVSIASEVNDNE